MLSGKDALTRCEQLIARTRALGADAADAVYLSSASESVHVRLGRLDSVERSENEHFGLRAFVGRRNATIGTSTLDEAAFDELAERAVAMARAAPEDPHAGLAPVELLQQGAPPDCDLVSPPPGPEALRSAADHLEDAARAVSGVSNSEGAVAAFAHGNVALVTSHGFAGHYASGYHTRHASVVAGEGAAMQRGSVVRTARYADDLMSEAEIGALAGERAVERLNPGTMASGPMPVVFDPRVGGSLINHLIAAMSGAAIARRSSFLLGREGERIFAPGIEIAEDPLKLRGLRSRPFDGEGLPSVPRLLIDDGVLTGWLMDSASARQLGRQPTGHAARGGGGAPGISASNVTFAAGSVSRDALIADIADGVLVTELIGQGVNSVTGDYSRGAAGFRITDGVIGGPVAGFTIAGNLLDMFAAMTPASDLADFRAINVPSLRIEGMTVAGG